MRCPACHEVITQAPCDCGWGKKPNPSETAYVPRSVPLRDPVPMSPEECAYREFQVRLMRRAMGRGLEGFARLHVESLSAWLADPGHLRWAQATPMDDCRRHDHLHTLAACLRDEIGYWALRAEGLSEAEAYQKLHVEVQP